MKLNQDLLSSLILFGLIVALKILAAVCHLIGIAADESHMLASVILIGVIRLNLVLVK